MCVFFFFFRQCMYCYRDIKNFERFQLIVQSLICLSIVQLKNIERLVVDHNNRISSQPSPSTSLTQNAFSAKPVRVNTVFSIEFITSLCNCLFRESNIIEIFNFPFFLFWFLFIHFSLHYLRRHHT